MKAPAKRDRSYTTANTTYLLDLIESTEPCGAEEWHSMTFRYDDYFYDKSRTGDNFKNYFKSLKNVKKPTGEEIFLETTDWQLQVPENFQIYR